MTVVKSFGELTVRMKNKVDLDKILKGKAARATKMALTLPIVPLDLQRVFLFC